MNKQWTDVFPEDLDTTVYTHWSEPTPGYHRAGDSSSAYEGDWENHPNDPVSEEELARIIARDYGGGKFAWR